MVPNWFELVAWAALAVCFASALVIGADIALLGNRQHMAIMDATRGGRSRSPTTIAAPAVSSATSAASGSSGRAAG